MLRSTELAGQLLAIGRQQRLDVIVDEVVEDHYLRLWIVGGEDRRLTIGVVLLGTTGW
jgi:hypothetical protein